MNKKKTLIIGISIILVCLAIALGYVLTHRSEKRLPTAEETARYASYSIDWQQLTGMEDADREIILSFCEENGEKTIGANVYQIYTSTALGTYLPDFGEMMELALLNEVLYIQYTTPVGNMITLGYDADGQCEKSIYDAAADTLYYETRETVEVWSHFRNGFQFG